ncbi:hypothetical protein [Paraburkholderia sediminicola]|uniref:hypothetical protein n=1 Tax=Paraburkholderia sediminicola TaxID=458836 RepID=UPI0038BCE56A
MTEQKAFFDIATKQYKEFCEAAGWVFQQPIYADSEVKITSNRIDVILRKGSDELWNVTFWDMGGK